MFDELLVKDGSYKIRDCNLQQLLIEILELKMKLAPEFMNEVFDNLECAQTLRMRFKSRNILTVRCRIEITAFIIIIYYYFISNLFNVDK